MGQCAGQVRYLVDRITELDGRIEAEADRNDDAKLLVSMTDMGPYIALPLAVEVGDISRVAGPKNLVSWAGLCPTVHQSGDRKYMDRMKTGTSTLVNWTMCEAANTAGCTTRACRLHTWRLGASMPTDTHPP